MPIFKPPSITYHLISFQRKLAPLDVAVPETREWIYNKLKQHQVIKSQRAAKTPKTTKLSQKQSVIETDANFPPKINPFEQPVPTSVVQPTNQ
jgi:hypothetical protein